MPTIIFGILVLVLALWVLNLISKADPKIAARVVKAAGGLVSLAFAVFLGVRGEIAIALPLGAFGLGLLGWMPFGPAGFSARTKRSSGQTSRVKTECLELELDHDTGAMRGTIVAGSKRGASLDDLSVETLAGLVSEFDDESRALLVAYLDRRDAGWREHAQADAATGRSAASSGKMSEQEAYQILGVEPGASVDDITQAHRRLMKRLHPDQGGSTYLAARINEAKEVLTRRHR
jgi:hypothetical protein